MGDKEDSINQCCNKNAMEDNDFKCPFEVCRIEDPAAWNKLYLNGDKKRETKKVKQ